MIDRLNAKPELTKKINGVFLYKITSGGQEVGRWTTDLKKGKIYRGDPEKGTKVDTTLQIEDADMLEMATGKLNPQAAFMKGKLKIQGNIMLSQKLKDLLAAESKM
ncbi:unnamed protein product [Nesidiocoris tenuis]|nr:unnamed protein product [Nesidiocoris tenuis]